MFSKLINTDTLACPLSVRINWVPPYIIKLDIGGHKMGDIKGERREVQQWVIYHINYWVNVSYASVLLVRFN